MYRLAGARIFKTFKEPRNRFQAWRAGSKTLFDITTRQATWAGDSLESIPGLLKRLQIRALQYDNPIPSRFLAPVDCSEIPAQYWGKRRVGEQRNLMEMKKGNFF